MSVMLVKSHDLTHGLLSGQINSDLPVNSMAFSKSAFSERPPFSGSTLTGVFSVGTMPEKQSDTLVIGC